MRKDHKYMKWAAFAIRNCVQEMGDPDLDPDTYMERLEDSIKFEREGDLCRKRGKYAEAGELAILFLFTSLSKFL